MGNMKDLTGKKFNKLTAIKPTGQKKNGAYVWLFYCDCGNTAETVGSNVVHGHTRSCGCLAMEYRKATKVNFDKNRPRIKRIWEHMQKRCYNPENPQYCNYGFRGIEICEQWRYDFTSFMDWSINNGYRPDLTIDRIDNDKGYSPDNCRWVDYYVQANNTRKNIVIEFNGEIKTLSEWSRHTGIPYSALKSRWQRHWTPEKMLTTPLDDTPKNLHIVTFNGQTKRLSEWSKEIGISTETLIRRMTKYKWSVERTLTEKVHTEFHEKKKAL